MKTLQIRLYLPAKPSFALLTLVFVSIASLGVLVPGVQAQATAVGHSGVPQNTAITTITVGQNPDCLVISPDNQTVYVANRDSDTVSIIAVANSYAVAS
jgi:DNA-binding beta-propeller fold protein YncE